MAEVCCKFCGKEAKLIKAHIVPRSFYTGDDSDLPHMIFPLGNLKRPKQSRTGLYDRNLNCSDCETYFSKLDTYAYEHLLGKKNARYVCRGSRNELMIDRALPVAVYSQFANIGNLKDFVCSVLWRASASELPELNGVKLGGFESVLKTMLTNSDTRNLELAIALETNSKLRGFVSVIGEWNAFGSTLYRFDAGGFVFMIKEKSARVEESVQLLFRPYNGKQMFMCRSEIGSVFHEKLTVAARENNETFGDPWKREKING